MKYSVTYFQGEIPRLGNTKLPDGAASSAVNSKIMTGDVGSFYDIANPFTLSKSAPIEVVYKLSGYWLQFSDSELTYGASIDISAGTIPGDTTYRTFITGISTGPRQTNLYYATDPSQQGSSTAGAYPYVTFPLGLAAPATAPTASTSSPVQQASTYEYGQPVSVSNAVVASAGTSYVVGDELTVSGGTTVNALAGATLKVKTVDGSGAITGISVLTGGFYTSSGAPTSPASVTGGTGSGATFTLSTVTMSYNGLSPQNVDNGAGFYITWSVLPNALQLAFGEGDTTVCYTTDAFSLSTAQTFTAQIDASSDDNGGGEYPDIILYLCGTPGFVNTENGSFRQLVGPAVVLSKTDGNVKLFTKMKGTNGGAVTTAPGGSVVDTASITVAGTTYYRIKATCTAQTSSSVPGFAVTVTIAEQSAPSTVLATLSGFIPYSGEQLGFGANHRGTHTNGNDASFSSFLITVQQPTSAVSEESTSYVYTYVSTYGSGANAITQESAPSDPSATLTIYTDTSTSPNTLAPVSVSIPAAPAGESITDYNLYRLVLQTDGSEVYQYVTQLASSTSAATSYTDTTLDADLGAAITTTDYAAPVSNLQGITALPNGVMAGFFDNTLALSAQNFPFAWPVGNQYSTDTEIVGIAAIDTTVLVLTTAHPYTAFGSDPGSYTMSKETASQGCISKRSIATHKRVGVIYAAGNGLAYYKGQGHLDLIRDKDDNPYFTFEQWQALKPDTIIGVVHDDFYWWWYDSRTYSGTGSKGSITSVQTVFSTTNSGTNSGPVFTSDGGVAVIGFYGSGGAQSSARSYLADTVTGKLTAVSTINAAGEVGFGFPGVTPDNKFVYMTGAFTNKLYAYAVDANTGILTAVAGSPFTTTLVVGDGQCVVSADGAFLFVRDGGSLHIQTFALNTTTGVPTYSSTVSTGGGGRQLWLSPDGAYLVAGTASSIQSFSINATTGVLTSVQNLALPGGYGNAEVFSGTPDGAYVFASLYNNGVAALYTRDATTGLLTYVDVYTTAASPYYAIWDDAAQLLMVGCNGDVSVFSLDTVNNTLTQVTGSPFTALGPATSSANLSPNGGFLYWLTTGIPQAFTVYSVNGILLSGKAGGYMLDIPSFFGFGGGRNVAGFGLIELDFHVTCVYVDPQTDEMFFTPDNSTYPVNGSVVTAALNVLSQWEGTTTRYRTQSWERDEILFARDTTFQVAQVNAEDYTNITLTLSSEAGTAFSGAITDDLPFILAPQAGRRWKVVIEGTSVVNTVTMAEKSDELAPQ